MKTICFNLLVILGLIALVVLTPSLTTAAPNAPFVVNNKSDSNDGACNGSHCTLREAINAANGTAGLDTINFNIAGCLCIIAVTSSLPTITDPVIINGYSQPGAAPNTDEIGTNAALQVQLSGLFAPPGTNGLTISGGASTVKGLSIVFFSGAGIWLKDAGGNNIQGNWLGVATNGISDLPNGRGILMTHGTTLNTVGGSSQADRNLISGNGDAGIRLDIHGGSANHNSIRGNIIGLDKTLQPGIPNGLGILILSKGNAIGYEGLDVSNYISGNTGVGIELRADTALKNKIEGNDIGQNGTYGIWVHAGASKNKIGKQTMNSIHENGAAGIAIQDGTSLRNSVRSVFMSNGGLGIDLGGNGVTPNDSGDADGGPNLGQNFPVLKLAEAATDRVKGKLQAAPNAKYKIAVYGNAVCDGVGFGEGVFLASLGVTTNANGVAKFNLIVPYDLVNGNAMTATATDKQGNTSEFSKCKLAQ